MTTLVERDGGLVEAVDRDALRERLDAGEFFWLDLVDPTPDDYATLRQVFEFQCCPASTTTPSASSGTCTTT